MTISIRVLVLIVFVTSGCAVSIWDDLEDNSYANSDVVILDEDNFDEKVLQNTKPSLVLFYADWCFYCEEFSTIYKQIATDLKETVSVVVLVVVVGLQCTSPDAVFENTSVEKLTTDSFESFLEKSAVIVMFYTNWSQKSKDFFNEYINLASQLSDTVYFGAFDCDEDDEKCHEYQVRDFPTLIIFEGGEHRIYTGERKVESLLKALNIGDEEYEKYDERNSSETNDYSDEINGHLDENEIERLKNMSESFIKSILYNKNDTEQISLNETDVIPSSSHVLTYSCCMLLLTMIANIMC
ncbi:unnamed protein product [Diamesa serratosioi]